MLLSKAKSMHPESPSILVFCALNSAAKPMPIHKMQNLSIPTKVIMLLGKCGQTIDISVIASTNHVEKNSIKNSTKPRMFASSFGFDRHLARCWENEKGTSV
jgi:hypothetical protein